MIVQSERVISCRSRVSALWPVVTDTERTNRAVGMGPVEYRPNSDETAARYVGSTNLGGFDVEYEERPSEWVFERYFRIVRKMRSGPVEQVEMRFDLEPSASGAKVTVRLSSTPKVALMAPIIRLRARQTLDRIEREIARVDAALAAGGPPPPLPQQPSVNADALEHAGRDLRARDGGPLVDRLLALVREADDLEVMRLRPFAIADGWGVSRGEVLSVMLHAVRAGLLELRWEVVCPSCRVASGVVPTLSSLTEHGSCQLCELEFNLELDEALEATFSPARAVRKAAEGTYCIAGPAKVPHVLAQVVLPSRAAASLPAPSEAGRYRLFVRGGATVPIEVAAGASARVEVDMASPPSSLTIAPGGAIAVQNATGEERHAKIERSAWSRQAATAREVTALPAFRRDFSSDVLKPGASLKVSRVGLFFSDLTGSTQLYSNVGDAAAFRLVQDHFDVVIGAIERAGGALVKTIGDAVMAVFADDLDGVRASVELLRAFERFRAEHPHRQQTHIKLGLFGGPCYVVTANNVLDYFGQTVNIAARLQAQAESGELVVSEELAERAIGAGVLEAGWVAERYQARLKGVDRPVAVARIALPPP